jgi:RNA binding exosome subunit
VIKQVQQALSNDVIEQQKIKNCMETVKEEMRYYVELEKQVLQRDDRRVRVRVKG